MRGEVCCASLTGGLSSALGAPPEIANALSTASTKAVVSARVRRLARSSGRSTPCPVPEDRRALFSIIGTIATAPLAWDRYQRQCRFASSSLAQFCCELRRIPVRRRRPVLFALRLVPLEKFLKQS